MKKNPLEELLIDNTTAEEMIAAQRKIIVNGQRAIILTVKEAYGLWIAACQYKHKALTQQLRIKLFELISDAERNEVTKLLKD